MTPGVGWFIVGCLVLLHGGAVLPSCGVTVLCQLCGVGHHVTGCCLHAMLFVLLSVVLLLVVSSSVVVVLSYSCGQSNPTYFITHDLSILVQN